MAKFSKMIKVFLIALSVIFSQSCNKVTQKTQESEATVNVPSFVADSAYIYIQKQVNFGPRVPNTKAHTQCADYLSESLKNFGAEVHVQKVQLTAYNGEKLNASNIIGVFNPTASRRILLCAHWDSRPWSDHDSDPANRYKPVMGANDGASGVGVLLEIARQLGENSAPVGVDIVFFDAEDYGPHEDFKGNAEDAWCLGSQYWSANPHTVPYSAMYGILLDMVGAKDATFFKEYFSMYYAASVVNKVWDKAQELGFSDFFIHKESGAITDDHYYVNKISGIPCIDIIDYNSSREKGFGDYWHTINDTMDNISVNTLHAVGTTLINVIFSEK